MRALLAPIALLATLSACASNPSPEGVPYRTNLPLQAQIHTTSLGVQGFYVNRPAYVAMFEVIPGRGVDVLYPYTGAGMSSGFVYGGLKTLPLGSYDSYSSAGWRNYSASLQSGPRYIYMIASEEPFAATNLTSFDYTMGVRFASYSAYNTMESLTRTLIRNPGRTNWTSDMFVYWPNVLYDRSMDNDNYVLITCKGRPYYVHRANVVRVLRTVCNEGRNEPPVIDSTTVTDGEDVPTRLRPTPKTDGRRTIWADLLDNDAERMQPERPRPAPRAAPRPEPRRAEPQTPRSQPVRIEPAAPRPQPQPRVEPKPVSRPPTRAIPVVRPRPDPVKPTPPPTKKKGGGGGGDIG